MRVVLINPKFHLPIDTRTSPHLALGYLGAVSERRGDTVRIYDADVEDQPLAEFLHEFKPHLVGITTNTPQVRQSWRAAAAIKKEMDIPIVLGGPHVSVVSEELDFESIRQPQVDIVVRGEGEGPWLAISNIVDSYLRDQPEFTATGLMDPGLDLFRDTLGLSYKTSDGQLHRNADAPVISDLDSLPWPAYHLFKMNRYTNLQPATDAIPGERSFSIMTSRGCPYRCTFCSQSIMPIKWRARSSENVVEEWRHLVRDLGALEIGVLDDSANIRRNRLSELADLIIANKLNHVPWIFVNGIRANLAEYEMLVKLKQAGLKRTAFGVETGDEEMIVKIDKHVDHDTIRQAFKNAKAAGLETIGFFIIGLPGDTRETMQKTIDFAIELDPMIANFSMMTPYPGTIVYEQVKKNGRFLMQDWEDYVFFDAKARYEMGDLTAELMEEMYRKAYRQFYWRPKYIARAMRRKDFWLKFGRNLRIAYRTVVPRREKTELRRAIESAQ
ncbi:MAG: Oxygen-independent coproporphyrinogen-III oxidase 1 [Chloroflexi bacterium ADurb.Bin325]|nr:MAG: Oxygen-independent coproporphyrinogen-III oxidase 1 [Chloroflexi bacterium ADurb.Bin325]